MFGFWKGLYAKLLPTAGIEFSDGRIKTQGSGSPEGVITASRGSEYTDTSTGLLWNKTTTSGNTGWTTGSFAGFADGSAIAPGAYFSSDPSVGWYYDGTKTTFVSSNDQLFSIGDDGQLYNSVQSTVGTDYTALFAGYLCRAWVNFNGTGTVAIRASGNVSSITHNGTGDYTINFTTALPDADYSPFISGGGNNFRTYYQLNLTAAGVLSPPTTSSFRFLCFDQSGAAPIDTNYLTVGVLR